MHTAQIIIAYRSEATPNNQALKLFSFILERGSQAYNDFVSVLLDSERHKHLGQILRGHIDTGSPMGESLGGGEEGGKILRGHRHQLSCECVTGLEEEDGQILREQIDTSSPVSV